MSDTPPQTFSFEVPDIPERKPKAGKPKDDRPRTPSSGRKTSTARSTVDKEIEQLRDKLTNWIGMAGIAAMTRNTFDGMVVTNNADTFVDGWLEVARVQPKFRKVLLQITEAGVYATAVSNTLAIALPILANHGMIPNGALVIEFCRRGGAKIPTHDELEQMDATMNQLRGMAA